MDTSHDGFEKKRDMVKLLLDMLKRNASDEVGKGIGAERAGVPVSGGNPADEPPAGLEQTKNIDDHHIVAPHDESPDQHKAPSGNLEHMAPAGSIDHPGRKKSFEAGAAKMADGGMALDSDEPEEFHIADEMMRRQGVDGSADSSAVSNLPGTIEDEGKERDEEQALHNSNMMDEDEDSNQSAFEAFLPRKKKK